MKKLFLLSLILVSCTTSSNQTQEPFDFKKTIDKTTNIVNIPCGYRIEQFLCLKYDCELSLVVMEPDYQPKTHIRTGTNFGYDGYLRLYKECR